MLDYIFLNFFFSDILNTLGKIRTRESCRTGTYFICALYSDCEKNLLEDEFIYAKEKADTVLPVHWKFRLQTANVGAFCVEQPEHCVC